MNILPLDHAHREVTTQRTRYHFRFPEYELHLNELQPQAATDWHHHEQVWETVVVTHGALTLRWRLDGQIRQRIIRQGDVVELEREPQSFHNHTDEVAAFLAIKLVLSGEDRRSLLQGDKVADE